MLHGSNASAQAETLGAKSPLAQALMRMPEFSVAGLRPCSGQVPLLQLASQLRPEAVLSCAGTPSTNGVASKMCGPLPDCNVPPRCRKEGVNQTSALTRGPDALRGSCSKATAGSERTSWAKYRGSAVSPSAEHASKDLAFLPLSRLAELSRFDVQHMDGLERFEAKASSRAL